MEDKSGVNLGNSENSGDPVELDDAERESRSFVLRIWRYRGAMRDENSDWYGQIESVSNGDDRKSFFGIERLVETLFHVMDRGSPSDDKTKTTTGKQRANVE